ncbi:hypothetical protein TrVFT333_008987 [Trichoderma virens FT-333]|nr:hypothetical protein TrVFT333_008987 [Trichoderma virens FT-333]
MGDQSTLQAVADAPFPLTEVDKWVLSQSDEDYKLHDWDDLKHIIDTNDLGVLKRKPSDLRRYIAWTAETKAKYGTITEFILQNRLPKAWGLPPFTPESQVPFTAASDYKVLLNDWPYGLAPGITHIVVWSRTPIPTDPESGDLTAESRARVEKAWGEQQVLWFKNWVALQSVRTLEHFHVLVRDVDDDMLERWTGERPRRE